jgi:phosphatidylglycerophosphate synthase
MLDALLRPHLEPPLARIAGRLDARGITADQVTFAGFLLGVLGAGALALGAYGPALALILANRAADGIDGALARRRGPTDLGGFYDIVLDFLVYNGLLLGFAIGRPEAAIPALFLMLSFVGTGTSFLAYAAIAARRGTAPPGGKALTYVGGLAEGTETIAALSAMCLFPGAFAWIAYGFGAICWATTIGRILAARTAFREGREG